MNVRPTRKGDGEALVRIHADMAAYYVDLNPRLFRTPQLEGYAEWLDAELPGGEDELDLVAEVDGEVVACLYAKLIRPPEHARYAYPADVSRTRVSIEYLATLGAHRRTGAGTALVEAAEEWGRSKGATVAETRTYHASPLSVPFWTERAGYERGSISLRKPLQSS